MGFNSLAFAVFLPLGVPRSSAWREDFRRHCPEIAEAFQRMLRLRLPSAVIVGRPDAIPVARESEMFADGVHLNREGQIYLSKRLVDHLEAGGRPRVRGR